MTERNLAAERAVQRTRELHARTAAEAEAGYAELAGQGVHRFDATPAGYVDIYDGSDLIATVKLGHGHAVIVLPGNASTVEGILEDPPERRYIDVCHTGLRTREENSPWRLPSLAANL